MCCHRGSGHKPLVMGPLGPHHQWFVPHPQTLGIIISIIDDLGVFNIDTCAIWHKIVQNHANLRKIARNAKNHSNLLKIARIWAKSRRECIGYIVSEIFYTWPHCQIVCPITSNFLATGLWQHSMHSHHLGITSNEEYIILYILFVYKETCDIFTSRVLN